MPVYTCVGINQYYQFMFRTFSQTCYINYKTMNSHPFVGDKKFFTSMSHPKREEYIKNMLLSPHEQGQPTIPSAAYPYEESFNYKNYKMNYFHTQLHSQPTALIFYMHGLNSYGGSSSLMGTAISSSISNTNVYALDFLNFGKSDGGYKGYIQSFQDIVSQAQAFVDYISKQFSNNPKKILIGCSFGGTISVKMGLLNPNKYSAIVFLTPALREVKQSQYIMKKLGKIIGYFLPKIKLTQQGTDDTKYQFKDAHKAFPNHYTGRNIPGTYRVVLNAIQEIEHCYSQFSVPYIAFQAGIDKLVDPFAVVDLQKSCKSKDKTTIYMKDMWHAIFYEQKIVDVIQLTIEWLKQRI